MAIFHVTYTDDNAVVGNPKGQVTIECSREEIWDKACEYGLVNIIKNEHYSALYSLYWDFNYLGVTEKQINQNLVGNDK